MDYAPKSPLIEYSLFSVSASVVSLDGSSIEHRDSSHELDYVKHWWLWTSDLAFSWNHL